MDHRTRKLIDEVVEITYQRNQWRKIAIAYMIQCLKAGPEVHEKAIQTFNEEQLDLVKEEVAKIMKTLENVEK